MTPLDNVWSIWLGAVLAVASGGITQWVIWLREKARLRAEQQRELLNQRREALGKLRGLATFYCDLTQLRYETVANFNEYEALLAWKSDDPGTPEFKAEATREISRERDLSLEQARCLKEIHYTVGFLHTLYPKDSQIDQLMRPIHDFRLRPKQDPLAFRITRDNLSTFRKTVLAKTAHVIDEEYRKPLLQLIDHLQKSVSVAA